MRSILIAFTLAVTFTLQAQSVTLMVINPKVNGSEVTYDVAVIDFVDIVAFQYEISYDTSALRLLRIENFVDMPDFGADNFGTETPGYILNLWLDPSLEGVTLADSTVLYQIVFEMLSDSFQTVCFSDDSTQIEFTGANKELFSIYVVDDCHAEPFLFFDNMTSVESVTEINGLEVQTINKGSTIEFSIDQDLELGFELFSLDGSLIKSFPVQLYMAGSHIIDGGGNVQQGMQLLVAKHRNQQSGLKIFFVD